MSLKKKNSLASFEIKKTLVSKTHAVEVFLLFYFQALYLNQIPTLRPGHG